MGPCPPAGPSSVACDRARELLSPPVINGTVHSERLAWFTATADDWHGSQRATTRVSGHSVCPLTWVSNPGAIVISGCDRSQAQTWQCCALACPQHHGCKGRRAHLGLVGGVQPATCTHSRHPSASPFGVTLRVARRVAGANQLAGPVFPGDSCKATPFGTLSPPLHSFADTRCHPRPAVDFWRCQGR
jgi:hypothetical protein